MFCKDVKNWLIKHQPEPPKGNALRRINSLACLIAALTKAERASFKAIAKKMDDKTDLESRIRSLGHSGKLILAIDGSTMGNGCMCLMVSIIWRGRGIPICWVVRKAPKGHFSQEMHVALINMVNALFKSVLSNNYQVILLGDGEFDGCDLQQACLDKGWIYVLKTAKNLIIADNPEMENAGRMDDMIPCERLNHIFLPSMFITKQGYGTVNLVYWHNKRYKNPLYLITNLEYAPDAERLYRKRYTIETLFADFKSRGFNMEWTKIGNPLTIFNLLIVASLAYIQAILFEFDARISPFLGRFCRKDRVKDLSVFQLGLQGLIYYIEQGLNISFQFSKNFPVFSGN